MRWIKLGEYSMFEELPNVPEEEVLAFNEATDAYLVGKLYAVHDGNSRDRMFFDCESENECLGYASHYTIITPPKQLK